jgi:S-DNA-T family DNA segregation ATPase FtsK/SpoIIIE
MKPIRIVLTPTRSRPLNILLGLVVIAVAAVFFLALASYHATDPSFNTASGETGAAATRNLLGVVGAYLADMLLQSFGLAAFLPSLGLAALGLRWIRSRSGGNMLLRLVGAIVAMLFVPALFALLPGHLLWLHMLPIEGAVGGVLGAWMIAKLGLGWTICATQILATAGIYFGAALSWRAMLEGARDWYERYMRWQQERAERLILREEEEQLNGMGGDVYSSDELDFSAPPRRERGRLLGLFQRKKATDSDGIEETPAYDALHNPAYNAMPDQEALHRQNEDFRARRSVWERSLSDYEEPAAALAHPEPMPQATPVPNYAASQAPEPEPAAPQPAYVPPASNYGYRPSSTLRFESEPEPVEEIAEPQHTFVSDAPAPLPFAFASVEDEVAASVQTEAIQNAVENIAVHERADAHVRPVRRPVTQRPHRVSGYMLPPTSLLSLGSGPQIVREDELREEAQVLREKCSEFGVHGQVVRINPGPMVTTYEFKPEAGVKYSRVTGLAEDLCLAMRAESILVERMAGQSTVGIQVPNHDRETISLRECLESDAFQKAKSKLTIAMGKDINGRLFNADLATMPHVLIAGSTGSGKSVAINAMIMSLLYRTTPSQVRLILVDPKRVELGMYEGIPHLFTPIITEAKLAANALRNAVREMERRLKLLASRSVRNIDQYNKLFDDAVPMLFEPAEDEKPLPYIVIIIDELADLMMLDRANVEESITRLAQMARAVGIHLVLATQRPSVDVITGLIKANVPSRISFRLATKVDSRTILDTNGAESLLGRGDMLFMPPGTSRHMRLHAPYVSEKETAAVVEFWKSQGQAEYAEGFLDAPREERSEADGGNNDGDENDPMYDEAVKLVYESGKASTSLMQRRLRIGYGRAAHLIDLMERDGLVGPADGSRPRELLKPPGWLQEVASMNGD